MDLRGLKNKFFHSLTPCWHLEEAFCMDVEQIKMTGHTAIPQIWGTDTSYLEHVLLTPLFHYLGLPILIITKQLNP